MNLYERANKYLDEQIPKLDPTVDNELEKPVNEDEGIEIYFDNLDTETQKKIMDAIKDEINATDDDSYSEDKIIEAFSRTPIITIKPSELKRQMNIDV